MRSLRGLRAGMPPAEARRRAVLALGGVEQTKERYRDRRSVPFVDHTMQDLRYAARTLRKSPGFAGVAVITLALGIGITTSIFSLIDAVLFKPVYADKPGELVEVVAGDVDQRAFSGHSYANYLDYRRDSDDVLSGLAAFETYTASLVVGAVTGRASVGLVSDNYFSVLGVQPLAGRTFRADENTTPDAHFVAVISESLWRRELGAAGDLTDRHISLNNAPYAVVGVVPERAARVFGVIKVDVFAPAVMQGQIRGGRNWLFERGNREFGVLGRLRPSVTLAQAKARFASVGERLRREYPKEWTGRRGPFSLTAVPASTMGREMRGLMAGAGVLLMGAVGCVMLIVCANLANVLLARTTNRRREIAVRLALGATRGRLVRQLLTETLLLATGGGVIGLLTAFWTKDLLNALVPRIGPPLVVDLSLDRRMLGFSIVLTILTAIAFGLLPALRGTRNEVGGDLQEHAAALTASPRRSRLRNALMIGQVAVSIVLLMSGGMFLRSLGKLHTVDLGFEAGNLALLSVDLGGRGYSGEQGRLFLQQARARLQQLPGVEAVTLAARVPMGLSSGRVEMHPENRPVTGNPMFAGFNTIGSGYFGAMRIPVVRGRAFDDRDRQGAPPTVIVNESVARVFWPNQDPIGQLLKAEFGTTLEVVGVVGNSRFDSVVESTRPFVYLPLAQNTRAIVTFHVRTHASPAASLEAFRRELVALDPTVAIFDVQTMDERLSESLFPVRGGAILLGAFGTFALGLASIGLYGVLAYGVSQRTKEIGIRLALGATPGAVRHLILKQGLGLTATGVAIGLVAGGGVTTAISTELYGLNPTDVATLASVVATQTLVALIACWVPARRATAVDPVIALRGE